MKSYLVTGGTGFLGRALVEGGLEGIAGPVARWPDGRPLPGR